jgi:hypothetical protein
VADTSGVQLVEQNLVQLHGVIVTRIIAFGIGETLVTIGAFLVRV